MAFKENQSCISLEASGDLSSNQFYFVDVDTSGQAAVAGDGADAVGVLQNDPDTQGHAATVAIEGVSRVSCGGSVTAGDDISSDTNGQGVTSASGDVVLGKALEDASGADSVIAVLLRAN
jgi:hypothetical protein